jgi:methionyl aminopeptidase
LTNLQTGVSSFLMHKPEKIVGGVYIKSPSQIEGIRKASQLAARILFELGASVKPGITTESLDELCHEMTLDYGAIPAPLNYRGFPKSVCVSVNEVVCHGVPGKYELKDGDLVNLDVTPILEGYFGDTNYTFLCGAVSEENKSLVMTAREAIYKGIEQVKPGAYLSNIGFKIQKFVEKKGYSVVRDYTGHGVGLEFHEPPTVLHYGRPNRGIKLLPGMVFTIEPMVNMGDWRTELDESDGWTVYTRDRKNSAQFEHSILVTETGYEILTDSPKLWNRDGF